MRHLYKTTRVVYDAHLQEYQVYYKNWLFWRFDSAYHWDKPNSVPMYYRTREKARQEAIERAQDMLQTVEIYRDTVIFPYV